MLSEGYYSLIAYNVLRLQIRRLCSGGRILPGMFQCLAPDTELILKGRRARIHLGAGTRTRRGVSFMADDGIIEIGRDVFFNRCCFLTSLDHVKIGDHCRIGPNVVMFDHDHRFGDQAGSDYNTSPIVIGNKVWIGANVVVLRGTRIGDSSVVGAGTVVQGDIPEGSIVTSSRQLNITKLRSSAGIDTPPGVPSNHRIK